MSRQSASDAAKKTTKESRSFGTEEVHARQPCGRPDPQPDPKEQADRKRMSHVADMGRGRRTNSPRALSTLLSSAPAYRSWRRRAGSVPRVQLNSRPPAVDTHRRCPKSTEALAPERRS